MKTLAICEIDDNSVTFIGIENEYCEQYIEKKLVNYAIDNF